MREAVHLAEALERLFAAGESKWFVSYPAAVRGLTATQAAYTPGPRFNSIWGLTLHLTLCQKFTLALLRQEPIHPETYFRDGAWPAVECPRDETAWEQAKIGALAANHDLAAQVACLSEEELEQDLPYVDARAYLYIQGQLAHNSNHLNEMVMVRHLQKLWLEKT